MAFLKAQWQLIVMGVVALLAIGGGVLAIMAGADVEAKMRQVSELVAKVGSYKTGVPNPKDIEAKKKEIEQKKVDFEESLNAALAMQKNNPFYEEVDKDGNVTSKLRKPIMEDILPEPKSSGVAISFRPKYKEEFKKLVEKLRARGGPTSDEIANEISRVQSMKAGEESGEDTTTSSGRGGTPQPGAPKSDAPKAKKEFNLPEFLRTYPNAMAADLVAQKIYMYVDDRAFGMHEMVNRSETPTALDIWQAQMALWIQQDIASALYRCNEERAAELRKQGFNDRLWVAYMPIKRLELLAIKDELGGSGGGSNDNSIQWPPSFTGVTNDEKKFVAMIELRMVVEESAVMNILGHLTSVGFYTPISVSYQAVPVDPLFDQGFVYGDEPVVDLTVFLEGYYFRAILEQWIPKILKPALKTPGAKIEDDRKGGRG